MRLWTGLRRARAAEAPRRWGSDRWDPRILGLRSPRWVMHKLAPLAGTAALHEVPTGVPGGCGSGDAAAALHRAAIGGTLDHVKCSGFRRVLKLAVLARAAPTDGVAAWRKTHLSPQVQVPRAKSRQRSALVTLGLRPACQLAPSRAGALCLASRPCTWWGTSGRLASVTRSLA